MPYRKKARQKAIKRILDLHTKALEPLNDDRLIDLLQFPNETEGFSDLVAHSSIAKMMTGNRYLEARLLDGGFNTGKPMEINLLPSQFMQIKPGLKYLS